LAGDLFAESRGPYSLLAYLLRSIFLDLAQRLEDEAVSVELANNVFDALTGPVEAAINGLKRADHGGNGCAAVYDTAGGAATFTPSAQTH
jgi:hypothetical protein